MIRLTSDYINKWLHDVTKTVYGRTWDDDNLFLAHFEIFIFKFCTTCQQQTAIWSYCQFKVWMYFKLRFYLSNSQIWNYFSFWETEKIIFWKMARYCISTKTKSKKCLLLIFLSLHFSLRKKSQQICCLCKQCIWHLKIKIIYKIQQ